MAKKREITVNDTTIRVVDYNNDDYISITDMLKAKEGDFSYPTGLGIEILLNF